MTLGDEELHAGIVGVGVVALLVVVAVTALFARDELQIVLYSAVYVAGVCAFWLGYWFLKTKSADRRERLLEQ